MTYSAGVVPPFSDEVIWFGSRCSIGGSGLLGSASMASTAWPTAAKAWYIPFVLVQSATLYRVGWQNGATAAGTSEVGVYDAGGTKIITGSATQTTISVVQWVDVTDTVLGPGQYWLAAMNSGTTGTYFGLAGLAAGQLAACGVLTQTSANPLPATATFALDNAITFVPAAFLQMTSVM